MAYRFYSLPSITLYLCCSKTVICGYSVDVNKYSYVFKET